VELGEDGENCIMRERKFVLLIRYYWDYQTKGDEMGGAYNENWVNEDRKSAGKMSLITTRH
jgi:hypothetical protein